MASIVPAARLTRRELRALGHNVLYAVDHDGEDLSAVNRSIEIHGADLGELFVSVVHLTVGRSGPRRPAA